MKCTQCVVRLCALGVAPFCRFIAIERSSPVQSNRHRDLHLSHLDVRQPRAKRARILGFLGAVGGLGWLGFAVAVSASNVTAVQFAVSEGGGASLTIPIQVPRGIGGMEPQLSLSYSSGAGNGLLGVGWSLQGPSAITRCPKSLARDGERGAVRFDADDRYCLDGQRLLLVTPSNPNGPAPAETGYGADGSEYRTESESFSRVKAVGSYSAGVPLGFRVETKAGLILEFGNVQDSVLINTQVLTKPSAPLVTVAATINRWTLRRIRDRVGSFVEFVYCQGEVAPNASAPVSSAPTSCAGTWTGSTPLHYIRYTNRDGGDSGEFGVVFRYESRPDVVQAFHMGMSTKQTQRMSAIHTYTGFAGPSSPGTLVRSYDIQYGALETGTTGIRATNASRIEQIQERGWQGGVATALPPVTFSMSPDSVFGMNVAQRPSASSLLPPPVRCGGDIVARNSLICP